MNSPGERIKTLRTENDFTQDELAEKLGCNKQSIYRYENNQSPMDTHTLMKASDFFKVTSDYLLGISNQKSSKDDIFNDHYATFFDEIYFWIFEDEASFGGHSHWVGFSEDSKEIRILRPIIPESALKLHIEIHGFPRLIINKPKEVRTFLRSGGNAFIRKSICEEYLPKFLKPCITKTYKPSFLKSEAKYSYK